MQKINYTKSTVFILIVVLSLIFYWYSYRPYQAKKKCNRESFLINHAGEINSPEWLENQESLYSDCLRFKGL